MLLLAGPGGEAPLSTSGEQNSDEKVLPSDHEKKLLEEAESGGRAKRAAGRSMFLQGVHGFRERKQRIGVNASDGAALREGDRNIGERDVLGKFGDNEDVKRSERKERRDQMSAQLFDWGADGLVAVPRVAEKPFAGVGGVADLMAIVGHALPLSGGGAVTI